MTWRASTSVAHLAAPAVCVAGGVLVVQLGSYAPKAGVELLAFGLVGPTATCAVAASLLTRPRPSTRGAALAALGGFVAEAVVAAIAFRSAAWGVLTALAFVGGGLLLTSPLLLGGAILARKKDLEAADRFTVLFGLWFALIECGVFAVTSFEFAWSGMAVALGALAVGVRRILRRRAWCSRVARGELEGWRLRAANDTADDAALPPLYGNATPWSVVERVEVVSTPYRSTVVPEAVGRIPSRDASFGTGRRC